jgi:hypothetical protein
MRVFFGVMLIFALVLSGCARKKAAPSGQAGSPRPGAAVPRKSAAPTPKTALAGEVARIDPVARFVVLSFSFDPMPALDQRLNLYRHGAKVGEVKVTGPQRDRNVVADILTGSPEPGDEVRAD